MLDKTAIKQSKQVMRDIITLKPTQKKGLTDDVSKELIKDFPNLMEAFNYFRDYIDWQQQLNENLMREIAQLKNAILRLKK